MKKMFNVVSHQGNASKLHEVRFHLTSEWLSSNNKPGMVVPIFPTLETEA
jgi:hypothetical protein